ncbi:transcriptional regulator [soil metagenome]
MEISKISGKATYHKVIRELHNFGYIKYEPSFNYFRGSLVYMFNFRYMEQNLEQTKNRTGYDLPLEPQGSGGEVEEEPSINNINLLNSLNNLNKYKKNKKKGSPEIEQVGFSDEGKIKEKEEKSYAKKEEKEKATLEPGQGGEAGGGSRDYPSQVLQSQKIPPSLEAVIEFFKTESYPEVEAVKFYNYFCSNGWLVGGKAPMKNWHAAAHSWMLYTIDLKNLEKNKRNYNPKFSAGHLHNESNRNKDYSEPL